MNEGDQIDLKKLKLVIFDVDGTLYNQKRLRIFMIISLGLYMLIKPWKIKEVFIIRSFRKHREHNIKNVWKDLEKEQYLWVAKELKIEENVVRKVIDKWIFKKPLKFLNYCKYREIERFIENLRKKNREIAIFSDYPAEDKLQIMNFPIKHIYSSTDKNINALKPSSKGLVVIMKDFQVKSEECLFIGDREDRDGLCAEEIQMPYLILPKKVYFQRKMFNFIEEKMNNENY